MNLPKLKGAIAENGYTQKMLANEMGLTIRSINRKLSGKVQFTVDEASKLVDILHLSDPASIFFGHDVP